MATTPGLIAVEQYDTAVRDNDVSVRKDDLTVCEDETFVNGTLRGLMPTSSKARTLKLPLLTASLCQTLVECLPKYRTLHELHFTFAPDPRTSPLVQSAFQRNSSVVRERVNGLLPNDATCLDWDCTRSENERV